MRRSLIIIVLIVGLVLNSCRTHPDTTLKWSPVDNATSYEFQLAEYIPADEGIEFPDKCFLFNTFDYCTVTDTNYCNPACPLKSNACYYWRVRAKVADSYTAWIQYQFTTSP